MNLPYMSLEKISTRSFRVVLISLLLTAGAGRSLAGNVILEGQNKGDTNNWSAGNLQNWQELDFIPCRLQFTSSQGNNQVIELDFEHYNNGVPGIQNIFNFTTSSNVVFVAPPVLSAPPTATTWSYSFTVNILDNQPA